MLTELKNAKKAVGLKQSRKAVKEGKAIRVYLAVNADDRLCTPIAELCAEQGVELCCEFTMSELGEACGINVGSAAAAILK